MKLIVGFRPQAYPGGKKNEFVIYNPKTKIGNKDIVRSKIISYIEKNPTEVLDFVILEGKQSYIKSAEDLAGEIINIIDDGILVEFEKTKEGISMNLSQGEKILEGMMPQNSIDQMNRVHKIMGNMDIGDRVAKDEGGGKSANLMFIRDPYENMESYETTMAKNKHFIPNWNVNQISLDPFKYTKPHGSHTKHKQDPHQYDSTKVTHLKENVLKFNEFNEINEGFKSNILAGLTALVLGTTSLDAQNITKIHHENEVKSLIKDGWSLDSASAEVLFNKAKQNKPNLKIDTIRLSEEKNQIFASGKFELNDSIKKDVSNILQSILDSNYILMKIEISSSTDKQQPSEHLKSLLKQNGFEETNKGLSEARSSSVNQYFIEKGINDSLISKNIEFEQGSQEVEKSARYVNIDFYITITHMVSTTPKISSKSDTTYYLSRESEYKKTLNLPKVSGKIEMSHTNPIKEFNKLSKVKCFKFSKKKGNNEY